MKQLIEKFSAHVDDCRTLDELKQMIADDSSWHKAHDLFDKIRCKALVANRDNGRILTQYCFEEACAKTLYNLSDAKAPFDEGSPYWIVPKALSLGRQLGIDETEITNIVTSY